MLWRNGKKWSVLSLTYLPTFKLSLLTTLLGGHIRPSVYSRMPNYIENFGVDAAVEVADFEFDHVSAIAELVDKEDIECEFKKTKSFDIFTNRGEAIVAKKEYLKLKKQGIASSTIDDLVWTDADRAEEVNSP